MGKCLHVEVDRSLDRVGAILKLGVVSDLSNHPNGLQQRIHTVIVEAPVVHRTTTFRDAWPIWIWEADGQVLV